MTLLLLFLCGFVLGVVAITARLRRRPPAYVFSFMPAPPANIPVQCILCTARDLGVFSQVRLVDEHNQRVQEVMVCMDCIQRVQAMASVTQVDFLGLLEERIAEHLDDE